jgi:hypothetical protein
MKVLSHSFGKGFAKPGVNYARLTTEIRIPISVWILEFASILGAKLTAN